MEFCKQFNARTQDKMGKVVPVVITVYGDKSFDFVLKTPPAAVQIIEHTKIKKGSSEPNRVKVASISWDQIRMIAEDKLPDLKKNILLHAEHFIKNVLEYDVNFKINSSWATEVIPKGFSQKHSHAHSFISGVYYPEYDKNFKISFYKKNHNPFWSLNVKKWNIYNSKKWTFMPNKNSIFLFLSDLEHEIVKNTSNKNRYSIAFNIIPIGQLGYEDIDLFIK